LTQTFVFHTLPLQQSLCVAMGGICLFNVIIPQLSV